MNINNYNTAQEFLEAFREERNLSQKALGEALGYREGSYINQIESGKKSASDKFFKKFCEVYTEFSFEDFKKLLERDREQEKNEDEGIASLDTNSQSVIERVITDNPQIVDFLIELSKNPEKLQYVQQGLSNPLLLSFSNSLAPHPEEIQADILEQARNNLENTLSNMTPKYTHKELKELLMKTINSWLLQAERPGYGLRTDNATDLSIEGHLTLSSSGLFFTLEATDQHLTITTCYQDRAYMEEFIKLVPGLVHRENNSGKLGSIYKEVPLHTVRIFNLSSLALSVKSMLTSMGVTTRNLNIESNLISSYFRS